MTRIIFLYGQDNRPRADIVIQNGSHKLRLFPLIDSGADFTTIPKGIGEALKLKSPKKKEIKTIIGLGGNEIKYVKRSVRIDISNYCFFIQICWLFEVEDEEGHNLLGRDIFEKFDILFKQNPHKKIIFESNKKSLK